MVVRAVFKAIIPPTLKNPLWRASTCPAFLVLRLKIKNKNGTRSKASQVATAYRCFLPNLAGLAAPPRARYEHRERELTPNF